jgi:hypothetical protein
MFDSQIPYLVGVDGGGTGTRVRMARADAQGTLHEPASADGSPSCPDEQVPDGRRKGGPFACAGLATIALRHADDPAARAILPAAGADAAAMVYALDPDGALPIAHRAIEKETA